MSIVVSLCDLTGIFVRPWAQAGFECYCVDIEHSIRRDREEQKEWRDWCASNLVPYAVVRSIDDVRETLASWGIKTREVSW